MCLMCLCYLPGKEQIVFLIYGTFPLVIYLRDAAWFKCSQEKKGLWMHSLDANKHPPAGATVSAPGYESPLLHLPPLLSITHIKSLHSALGAVNLMILSHTHAEPPSPLSPLLPPSPSSSNWFSPLYGCPLATTFDPYSTLTSACPYQCWLLN